MVVLVEDGLDNIKSHLISKGYSVCSPFDNVLYDAAVLKNNSILSLPKPDTYSAKNSIFQGGVFLVYAKNQTPEQIEQILRQKTYGKLF